MTITNACLQVSTTLLSILSLRLSTLDAAAAALYMSILTVCVAFYDAVGNVASFVSASLMAQGGRLTDFVRLASKSTSCLGALSVIAVVALKPVLVAGLTDDPSVQQALSSVYWWLVPDIVAKTLTEARIGLFYGAGHPEASSLLSAIPLIIYLPLLLFWGKSSFSSLQVVLAYKLGYDLSRGVFLALEGCYIFGSNGLWLL
ncbi:hypothetical protein KIPB_001618 [Kipferlia bialata]|uniref:Uncharacterized protein n=1 Tax=Kipferlia bialata TaxID=797122 RepID=A0A9K3CQK5_9EUKA|nr:hypothetical protein KIPB_001618 [Kipferlia bialata]|eukprot:g1618.t1